MNGIEEAICKLDVRLGCFQERFAFLGGSVLSLLVTDPSVDAIRVTKDVDVMMDIRTRKDFHRVDKRLEQLGFKHDTREDAPICRWIYDGVTVDVLPIHEDVLGWKSRWFSEALESAEDRMLGDRRVRIVSAPYFVALKIEAFEDRGKRDFLTSSDFEDIICLFNGRETVVDEIASCETLRRFLAARFEEYLAEPDLEDAVDGFVQTEPSPEQRKRMVMARFARVSRLGQTGDSPHHV